MAYKIAKCGGFRYDTATLKEINGTLTSAENDELVGVPFVAPMCGGIKFDNGVFSNAKIGDKDVITVVGATPDTYMKAHCALLLDADVFEVGDDDEIIFVE